MFSNVTIYTSNKILKSRLKCMLSSAIKIRINKNLNPSSGIHEAQRTPLFVSQTRSEKPPKSPEIVELPSPPLTKSLMKAIPTQSKSIEAQTPFLVKCKFCPEEEAACFTSIYLWKEHCIKGI